MVSALAVVALVGRLVVLYASLMLVPLAFALGQRDTAERAFIVALSVTFAAGAGVSLLTWRHRRELKPRDGFMLVTLTWLVLPAFSALPLLMSVPGITFTQAYFEAMSALTATGATALSGLDALPLSVNVWRCFMQWIGGLGIIVLAVAILPLLGVGGSQLFSAEFTGPIKDQKLTPRIADTARALWVVYLVLSVACFLAYGAAGMGWSDAFMHMSSTVSLGGFSSHDTSFGYWNSPGIEAVAVVFMLLAGVNLTLYFVMLRHRSTRPLLANPEVRGFYALLGVGIAVIAIYLLVQGQYATAALALRHSVFHVVSVATTTGFTSDNYALWPTFAPLMMILLGCFATCAGSTGGGIKMIRLILLVKQARHELVRIVHPNVVNPVVVGGRPVSDRLIGGVIAYMMIYGASIVMLTMLLLFTGLDPVSAFTAVLACFNNIGPGLGEVGPASNYGALSAGQTWICTFAMLLGRLELLTVVVLFTRHFWRV
jgi:trk system potassium uptake protein TrkH